MCQISVTGKNRKESGFDFWDVVVVTASNYSQKATYEKQLDNKLKNEEIPKGLPYLVFSDPTGPKVGKLICCI